MSGPIPVNVNVEGVDYPLDYAAINALQVVRMRRDIAVDVGDMVERIDTNRAQLPEVVALQMVSLEQAGEEVTAERLVGLLTALTLSSAVLITTPELVDA